MQRTKMPSFSLIFSCSLMSTVLAFLMEMAISSLTLLGRLHSSEMFGQKLKKEGKFWSMAK
jgi:hypothetical protein